MLHKYTSDVSTNHKSKCCRAPNDRFINRNLALSCPSELGVQGGLNLIGVTENIPDLKAHACLKQSKHEKVLPSHLIHHFLLDRRVLKYRIAHILRCHTAQPKVFRGLVLDLVDVVFLRICSPIFSGGICQTIEHL